MNVYSFKCKMNFDLERSVYLTNYMPDCDNLLLPFPLRIELLKVLLHE
jgi:hypothetical protein